MELSDDEISLLDTLIGDAHMEVLDGDSGYVQEDQDLMGPLFEKVRNEAKERKLWWV